MNVHKSSTIAQATSGSGKNSPMMRATSSSVSKSNAKAKFFAYNLFTSALILMSGQSFAGTGIYVNDGTDASCSVTFDGGSGGNIYTGMYSLNSNLATSANRIDSGFTMKAGAADFIKYYYPQNSCLTSDKETQTYRTLFYGDANYSGSKHLTLGGRLDVNSGIIGVGNRGTNGTSATNSIRMGTGTSLNDTNDKNNAITIGVNSSASAESAVALGNTTTASGESTVAIGTLANSTNYRAVAVGYTAQATGSRSTALGTESVASVESAVAIGDTSNASAKSALALGTSSVASGTDSAALGSRANATATSALAVGSTANATAKNATAVGGQAQASGETSVALGTAANASKSSTVAVGASSSAAGDNAVAVGVKTTATTNSAIAIGNQANATGETSSIAIGRESVASGTSSIAQGYKSSATGGTSAIAIGRESSASGTSAIAQGYKSSATVANSVALGSNSVANTAAGAVGTDPLSVASTTDLASTTWKSTYAAVSVGNGSTATRQITSVAAGTQDTDAVNVAQLKVAGFKLATTASAGEVDNSSTADKNIQNGETLTVDAGKNIKVTQTGQNVSIATKDEVEFTSVTAAGTKLSSAGLTFVDSTGTQVANSPSITATGINAGNNKITNVANGTGANDAVNFSQLQASQAASKEDVKSTDKTVTVTKTQGADNSNIFDLSVNVDGTSITKNSTTGALQVNTTTLTTTGGKVDTPANTNALATASDIANAINNSGFTAKANSDSGELITAGEEVNFINGENIAITRQGSNFTVATAKDVTFNSVSVGNVKVDGTTNKITGLEAGTANTDAVNVGQLNKEVAASKEAVITSDSALKVTTSTNTTTGANIYDIAVNTVALTTGTNGSITAPATADEGKLVTAKDVASAINNAGFTLKTSANGGKKDTTSTTDELINAGEVIDLVAGKNLTVKQEANGTVTYALAKEIDLNKVTTGNTVMDTSGITIAAPTGATTTAVKLTNTGLDNGGNKITNVAAGTDENDAVNIGQLTDELAIIDDAIAASQEEVTSNDKSVTIATTQNADGANVFDLSVNVDDTTITKDASTGQLKANTVDFTTDTAGNVTANTNANALATAGDIAKAINSSGFTLKTSATADGEKTSGSDELINPGDVIDLVAGKNLTVKQEANGTVTYATKNDVNFTTVTTEDTAGNKTVTSGTGIVITPNTGNAVSLTDKGLDNGGNKIINVAAGTLNATSTDAVNASQLYATNLNITNLQNNATHYYSVNDNGVVDNNYNNDGAKGINSLAAGVNASTHINSENSVAVGHNSHARGESAVVIGNEAGTDKTYTYNSADGSISYTLTGYAASGKDSVSVGAYSGAKGTYSTALGAYAHAPATRGTAIGVLSSATKTSATAIGDRSVADGTGSTAIGEQANASGIASTVIGKESIATGNRSVATGFYAQAIGTQSIATGQGSKAFAQDAIAIGTLSTAGTSTGGVNSIAIGREAKATGESSVAQGYKSSARLDNSVALGSNSVANTDKGAVGTDPLSATNATDLASSTWTSTAAAVSVGDVGNDITRQITSVAAGTQDTDAVNVAQLKAAGFKLATTASAGGVVDNSSTDDKNIQNGETLTVDAGKNIKVTQTGQNVSIATKDEVEFTSVIATGTKLSSAGLTFVDSAGTQLANSPSITATGINAGGTKITNVAAGEADTDAVNVAQLGEVITLLDESVAASQEEVKSTDNSVKVTTTKNTDQANVFDLSVNVDEKSITKDSTGALQVKTTNLTTTTDGKVDTPTDTDALATAANVADAINKSGFTLKTSATADGKKTSGSDELINPGDVIDLVAGKNLTVKQEADGKITYALADEIELDKVTTGNTTMDTNGITIAAPTGATTTAVKLTNTGLDNGGNKITNVAAGTDANDAVNVSQLQAAQAASKETVTSDEGSIVVGVKTDQTTGANIFDLSVNVDDKTITKDSTGALQVNTTDLTVTDGKVATPTDTNALATAANVADAINKSGFTLKTSATADGKKTSGSDELINPSDTIEMVAGKNLTVTQEADGKITYATADKVGFEQITLGDATNNTVLTSTEKGLDVGGDKITNVANGDISPTSTDAINGSQLSNTTKSIADALGGSSTVNTDGTITAPTYTLVSGNPAQNSTKAYYSVGNALNALNTAVNAPLTFAADSGNNVERQLGSTLNINGDAKNITTTTTSNGVTVALNDNISVKSVSVENGPTINSSGIQMANQQITGLKSGLDGTTIEQVAAQGASSPTWNNAATVGDLAQVQNNVVNSNNRINQLNDKINNVDKKLRAGVAGALATSGLPQAYIPGKSMVAIAAGSFKGENALAVGATRISDNGKVVLKLTGNTNTRGDVGTSVGLGYQW
ncbi:YadA-like family protein [Lonepinella sp. MS14437]|uniref:YadA-like family protein n=1 Tax=Lonepinella sp. MS14437 TaxID=3003620 RepID=UPI0036DBF1EF